MPKQKFTTTQIMVVLNEQSLGKTVFEICRKHKIARATFYHWKNKYASADAIAIREITRLEAELAQYKKIVAEQAFRIKQLKSRVVKSKPRR